MFVRKRPFVSSVLVLASQLSLLLSGCAAWVTPPAITTTSRLATLSSTRRLISISSNNDKKNNNNNDSGTATSSSSTDSSPCDKIATSTVVDWDWQAVVKQSFQDSTKPIILFDGVCLFCNAGVDLCLELDKDEHFRFASLQSKVGQSLLMQNGKEPDDLSSIVLVESEKQAYFESDAILRIAKELKGLPRVIRGLSKTSLQYMPEVVRNAAYHFIANRRYMFGHREECRLDFDGTLDRRVVHDPPDLTESE